MRSFTLLVIPILLLTFSCRLGPRYEPPCAPTPDKWKAEQPEPEQETAAAPLPDVEYWWEVFQDEVLTDYVEQAIQGNPSLMAALERVVEAQAIARVDEAALYPQVTSPNQYYNTGQLIQANIPPGLAPVGLNIPSIFRIHTALYQLPAQMNYEVDLWGKLRGRYDSSYFAAEAQIEAYHAMMLSLTSEIASDYFQIRSIDNQIDILEDTIKLRKQTLSLNQSRFDRGLISELDVVSAQQEVTDAEATLFDTIRQRKILEDAVATLIGLPASEFCMKHNPLKDPPPVIPPGVPSTILLQRPDIMQAERTVASEQAQIGVAYAAFFPSLNLTGILGFSSPDLRNFLKWKSRWWFYGANANESIFDGGRNCANLDISWANFREASANYQQQVLTAFKEVEDSLNSLEYQYKQYDALSKSVTSAERRLTLSSQRYNRGLTNYLDVIDSERSTLNAELSKSNLLGQRYISTVQLIKALGGSWEGPNNSEVSCDEE